MVGGDKSNATRLMPLLVLGISLNVLGVTLTSLGGVRFAMIGVGSAMIFAFIIKALGAKRGTSSSKEG